MQLYTNKKYSKITNANNHEQPSTKIDTIVIYKRHKMKQNRYKRYTYSACSNKVYSYSKVIHLVKKFYSYSFILFSLLFSRNDVHSIYICCLGLYYIMSLCQMSVYQTYVNTHAPAAYVLQPLCTIRTGLCA